MKITNQTNQSNKTVKTIGTVHIHTRSILNNNNNNNNNVGAQIAHINHADADNPVQPFKKQKGITLIALIITVIVLLILVSVTLKLIAGGDGILGKAERAVNTTNESAIKEEVEMAISEKMIGYYTDGIVEGKTLAEYISEQFGEGYKTASGATIVCNNNGEITYTDKRGNMFVFQMDEAGNIEKTGEIRDGKVIDTAKPKVKINATTSNSIQFTVTDNIKAVAYAVTQTNKAPEMDSTDWQTIPDPEKIKKIEKTGLSFNQTYYVWAKDAKDNVSTSVEVKTMEAYSVTYNANGGAGGPTDTTMYIKGANVTVKFEPLPTKVGNTFLGWTDDENNKGTAKYTASGTNIFSINGEVTLYAVWESESIIRVGNPGEYVDLETDLLDRTIQLSDNTTPTTDWRLFSKDGENVWLIMSDYLPYSYESLLGTGLSTYGSSWPYNWKSDTNREDLINRLKGTTNGNAWNKLLDNTSLDTNRATGEVTLKSGITITGALEIETWRQAWNAVEETHLVISGDDTNGYKISIGEEGTEASAYRVDIRSGNTLFGPHSTISQSCWGYWLASPSAKDDRILLYYTAQGGIYEQSYSDFINSVRPAIHMPANLLTKDGNVWKLKK